MTNDELLLKIKNGLGITTNYQDATLQVFIDDVKAYMMSAGVLPAVVDSQKAVGCILRGVADLWNYGSGNATLSDYFKSRMLQLKHEEVENAAIMHYETYIPTLDEISVYGWHTCVMGIAKNLNQVELTVTNEQIITALVTLPDGTTSTGENSGTGNRRVISVNSEGIYIMPNTVYDITQSKFVDNENTTCIAVPEAFYGSDIVFETFEKAV